MKPFLQFRLWTRQGPPAERVLAAVAGIVALALVGWAAVPAGSGSRLRVASPSALGSPPGTTAVGASGSSAAGSSSGPTGSIASSGSTGGAASPGAVAGPLVGSAGPGNGGQAGPASAGCDRASNEKGITPTQITVGVILVDLGQLNPTLGIPSYGDEQKAYDALFADYNKRGGVRCRTLVPRYYRDNVLQASSEQGVCLQIEQDGVFAVLNNLYNPQEFNCLAQRHIPNVFYTAPHTPAMQQYSPYVMAPVADYHRLIKDYVLGAQQLGLLSGQKIGILEQACYPEENTDIEADLASIGIGANKLTRFNYGCNTNVVTADTPDQNREAVLQFQSSGVTLVLQTARAVVQDFASSAEQQGYKPKYLMMNDQSMALIATSSTPIPTSMDGTISITPSAEGETNTAGWQMDAATADCTKIMTGAGVRPPRDPQGSPQSDNQKLALELNGSACDAVAVFVAAASHAPSLVRSALAQGLALAGPLNLSYPDGPMHVTDPNDPTGGQSWRPAQWYTACNCWKVMDLRWRDGWT
jgi:hypothetical protein